MHCSNAANDHDIGPICDINCTNWMQEDNVKMESAIKNNQVVIKTNWVPKVVDFYCYYAQLKVLYYIFQLQAKKARFGRQFDPAWTGDSLEQNESATKLSITRRHWLTSTAFKKSETWSKYIQTEETNLYLMWSLIYIIYTLTNFVLLLSLYSGSLEFLGWTVGRQTNDRQAPGRKPTSKGEDAV